MFRACAAFQCLQRGHNLPHTFPVINDPQRTNSSMKKAKPGSLLHLTRVARAPASSNAQGIPENVVPISVARAGTQPTHSARILGSSEWIDSITIFEHLEARWRGRLHLWRHTYEMSQDSGRGMEPGKRPREDVNYYYRDLVIFGHGLRFQRPRIAYMLPLLGRVLRK
jgi:hypothetical protein